MLLSAVSIFVVAQSSSEIPEGLMNNCIIHFYLQGAPGKVSGSIPHGVIGFFP